MAIVAPQGRIINQPERVINPLIQQISEFAGAIQSQRQQAQTRQDNEALARSLSTITDPRKRFQTTLEATLGFKTPEARQFGIDLLTQQRGAIPTTATRNLGTTLGNVLRAKNIDPNTATAADIKTATEDVKRGQLQQSVAVETAKLEAQGAAAANLPLIETNTTLATKLVRADNGGPIPAGLTSAQFRANPGAFVPVTTEQKRDLGKINASIEIADRMSSLVKELFPEGESRVAGAARRTIGGFLQTNSKVVEFNRLRKAGAGPMARALGEVGNLAEGDVDRAMAIWPVGTDSSEVAIALVNLANDLVLNMRDVTLKGGRVSDINRLVDQAEAEGNALRAQDKRGATPTTIPTVSGLSPEAAGFLGRK